MKIKINTNGLIELIRQGELNLGSDYQVASDKRSVLSHQVLDDLNDLVQQAGFSMRFESTDGAIKGDVLSGAEFIKLVLDFATANKINLDTKEFKCVIKEVAHGK